MTAHSLRKLPRSNGIRDTIISNRLIDEALSVVARVCPMTDELRTSTRSVQVVSAITLSHTELPV
jgi:hypothetical protein